MGKGVSNDLKWVKRVPLNCQRKMIHTRFHCTNRLCHSEGDTFQMMDRALTPFSLYVWSLSLMDHFLAMGCFHSARLHVRQPLPSWLLSVSKSHSQLDEVHFTYIKPFVLLSCPSINDSRVSVVGRRAKVKSFPSLFSEWLAQDLLHFFGNDCEVFCLCFFHLHLWLRGCCTLHIIEHAILFGILYLHGSPLVLLKPTVNT